mmetsp:Transcript_16612/g.46903  ORF Transcript_16612/g.46903 Transcript_16612/m.46903 type:complete len:388 (-) Transcript_16612:487-1650(-)
MRVLQRRLRRPQQPGVGAGAVRHRRGFHGLWHRSERRGQLLGHQRGVRGHPSAVGVPAGRLHGVCGGGEHRPRGGEDHQRHGQDRRAQLLRLRVLQLQDGPVHRRHVLRAVRGRHLPHARLLHLDAGQHHARHHRSQRRRHVGGHVLGVPQLANRRRPRRHHAVVGHLPRSLWRDLHPGLARDQPHHRPPQAGRQPAHQRPVRRARAVLHPDLRHHLHDSAQRPHHQGLAVWAHGLDLRGLHGGHVHCGRAVRLPVHQEEAALGGRLQGRGRELYAGRRRAPRGRGRRRAQLGEKRRAGAGGSQQGALPEKRAEHGRRRRAPVGWGEPVGAAQRPRAGGDEELRDPDRQRQDGPRRGAHRGAAGRRVLLPLPARVRGCPRVFRPRVQ